MSKVLNDLDCFQELSTGTVVGVVLTAPDACSVTMGGLRIIMPNGELRDIFFKKYIKGFPVAGFYEVHVIPAENLIENSGGN